MPAPRTGPLAIAAAALLLAGGARAITDGNPPKLFGDAKGNGGLSVFTVRGSAVPIGNTLLKIGNDQYVNSIPLSKDEARATLTLPNDATVVAAYLWWSASGNDSTPSVTASFWYPDASGAISGPTQVTANSTASFDDPSRSVGAVWYARADVTDLVKAHPPTQLNSTGASLVGDYSVDGVNNLRAGVPDPNGVIGNCGAPFCQSAFAGWSLVVVYASPTASSSRNVAIYDGFLRLDEQYDFGRNTVGAGTSGVIPPQSLGGFLVGPSHRGEISFFGLEGDPQLGFDGFSGGLPTPEPPENADWIAINNPTVLGCATPTIPGSCSWPPVGGTSHFLQDALNPWGNLFNSTGPFAPNHRGVDLDRFDISNLISAGQTSLNFQAGSGDGVPNPGWSQSTHTACSTMLPGTGTCSPSDLFFSNGEYFLLGWTMVALDTVAPDFSLSTKSLDVTTVAPGDTITFTIKVINTAKATTVTVQDLLPAGVTYVPGSTTAGAVGLPVIIPIADVNGNTPLAAGAGFTVPVPVGVGFGNVREVDFTLKAKVNADTFGQTICNSASVFTPDLTQPVKLATNPCATVVSPKLATPALSVSVNGAPSASAPHTARPGDVLRYKLTLQNTGAAAARNLKVHVDAPPFSKGLNLIAQGDPSATAAVNAGGANGTGQIDLSNVTLPANFSIAAIWEVTVFSEADFLAAGVPTAGIDGKLLPEQAAQSLGATVQQSDDPATPASPDPTTVVMRYAADLSTSGKQAAGGSGGLVVPGDTITYTIALRNAGNRTASVSFTDDLPPGVGGCTVTPPIAQVACSASGGANGTGQLTASGIALVGGATQNVIFTVKVRGDAANGLQITNTCIASAPEVPAPATLTSNTLTVKALVDLSASAKTVRDLTSGSGTFLPGDTVEYLVNLRNSGTQLATGLNVIDPLPPLLTLVPGSILTSPAAPASFDGASITWQPADLAGGANTTLTYRAVIAAAVPVGSTITNTAVAKAASGATASPAVSFRVTSAPQFTASTKLAVDVQGRPTTGVFPGDQILYTLSVKNSGNAPASSVRIDDPLDANLVYQAGSASGGGTFSGPASGGGTVSWVLSAPLLPGDSASVQFVASLLPFLVNGTRVDNAALVSAAELSAPQRTSVATVTVQSSGSLSGSTKTAQVEAPGVPLAGRKVRFTFTLAASGNQPAADVVLLDPLAACLVNPVPGNGGVASGAAGNQSVRWDKGTTPALAQLLPGAPVTLTLDAQINPAATPGTVCSNLGHLTSSSDPAADTSTASFTVVALPDLSSSIKAVSLKTDANGDGLFSPGDRVAYAITVINNGTADASSVVLADALPAELINLTSVPPGTPGPGGSLAWSLGRMAPGAKSAIVVEGDLAPGTPNARQVCNQGQLVTPEVAAPVGTRSPGATDPGAPKTCFSVDSHPNLALTKTLAGNPVRRPGDTLVYTLALANSGTAPASGVALADTLDSRLTFVSAVATAGGVVAFSPTGAKLTATWPGPLAPGSSFTVTLTARLPSALDNGTQVPNQAQVTAAEFPGRTFLSDDPSTAAPADPTVVTIVSGADLTGATKTVAAAPGQPSHPTPGIHPGDVVRYTLTLTNAGDADAKGVVVTDPVDGRLSPVTPIPNGGVLSGGAVKWTLPQPLKPSDPPLVLSFDALVQKPLANGTVITNQASITALGLAQPQLTDDPSQPGRADPTRFTVVSAPDLTASTKAFADTTRSDGTVHPGDSIIFTIQPINAGDAETTTTVVSDALDAGLDFVSAGQGGVFDPASGTVRWSLAKIGLDPLPPVTLVARVKKPLPDGTVVKNAGRFDAPELPAAGHKSNTVTLTISSAPDLSGFTKVAQLPSGAVVTGPVSPGTVLTYALRLPNSGDARANNLVVTDPVDAGFDQVTPLDGGALSGSTVTWTAASLDPGQAQVFRFTARVKPLTANGTVLVNQAAARCTEKPNPQPSDDPATPVAGDPTLITVVSRPDLSSSTKVVAVTGQTVPGLLRPGDALRYSMTVINTGDTYATNVVVRDPLDPLLSGVAPDQGGQLQAGAITWTSAQVPALAKLAPGAANAVLLTFSATVAATAHDGDVVANQAQLTEDEGLPFVSDDPATAAPRDATRVTVRFADVRADKMVAAVAPRADGTFHPGDLVDYTIAIRNRGSFPASNLAVGDPIDPALTDLTPGQGGVIVPGAGGRPSRINWSAATTPALAQLVQGALVPLTFRARVRPLTRDQTLVSNQALITAPELNAPVSSDDPSTPTVGDATRFAVTAQPDLRATTKTVKNLTRQDGTFRPGDQVQYAISVQNSGDTWASNVAVRDVIDAGLEGVALTTPGTASAGTLQWDKGSVPALAQVLPGDVIALGFTARVVSGARDGQLVQNQALLADDEQQGGPPQRSDDPSTPAAGDPTVFKVLSGPRLASSIKTVTNVTRPGQPVRPGDTLEYELHILNDGTEPALNTVLTDTPPPLTTYVPGSTRLNGNAVADLGGQSALGGGLRLRSPRAGTPDGLLLASTGAVPDDTAAVVDFRVKVVDDAVAGSLISNQGQLHADKVPQASTDDPSTPQPGDATVVVVGSGPALDALKTWSLVLDQGNPGVADPGDVIEYRIELRNRGTEAVKAAVLADAIPALTTYQAGTLKLDGAALTDARDSDAGDASASGVNVAVGGIDSGKSRVVTFRVHLDAAGTVSNQATVRAAGGLLALSDGDPTLPGEQPTITSVGAADRADLSGSSKTVTDVNGGDVLPGDELLYAITLVNSGGKDTTGAVIEDPLPQGLTYLQGSAQGDGVVGFFPSTGAPGIVRASAITVKAGGRAQLRFRARVNPGVALGSLLKNVAATRTAPDQARLDLAVSVAVGEAQGTYGLLGTVFHDLNGNGARDPGERPLPGFQVLLRRIDQASAPPLRTQLADAQGRFSLRDLPGASYAVEVLSPEGTHFADLPGSAALAGAVERVITKDIPVQVTGVLVRGADRTPASGARVVLLYDDGEVGKAPPSCETDRTSITSVAQPLLGGKVRPRPVAAACLGAGQQAQVTGELGYYRFDLVSPTTQLPATGDGQRGYRLEVLPGTPLLTFPGSKPAPDTGVAGAGPVVPSGDPAAAGGSRWFTRFRLAPGDVVLNNHAVLDPAGLRLVKSALRSSAIAGDIVGYSIALQNPTNTDVLIDPATGLGGIHFADVLPEDFRYARGSARATRLAPPVAGQGGVTQQCPRIDQAAQGPACAAHRAGPATPDAGKHGDTVGRFLDFGPYDLRAGESIQLQYQATVGATAKPGDHLNRAVARAGNVDVSNSDSALVRVAQDPLFDLTSLIGKVYCEATPDQRTRRQDPGEEGVPGVRIYQDEGWYAETDVTGKFHFRALQPGVHRFKIDARTLPPGAEVQEGGAITVNLTRGLDARANFAVTCRAQASGPDRFTLKNLPAAPPPPPAPPWAITIDAAQLRARVDAVPVPLAAGGLRRTDSASEEPWVAVDQGALVGPVRFGVLLASGTAAEGWRLRVTDEAGAALGGAEGKGAPPGVLEWTPSTPLAPGGTLRAQLELTSAAGTRAGPLLALRLVPPQPPPVVIESFVLHGVLFDESGDKPTRELGRQLAGPIAKAKAAPELLVRVEVHTAGEGSAASEQALSDARARAVREALLAAGIAPERVLARGRGNEVPLVINVLERGRLQNRRVAITLEQPPPPAPPPQRTPLPEQVTLDGRAPGASPQLPRGATAQLELQRPDGTRASIKLQDPPLPPALPAAVRFDPVARELTVAGARFALPLLGLHVEPLVDGVPERSCTIDGGGVPRALAFGLEAPVLDAAGWKLTLRSEAGVEVLTLSGDGAPPLRAPWPEGQKLGAGRFTASLTVRERAGGEGQSPPVVVEAAPPSEPVLRQTVLSGALFAGRSPRLSADGLGQLKKLVPKLQQAAGEGGKIVVEVFSDDAANARKLTEDRAAELKRGLAASGLAEARISARGRGAANPVAPNATAPGRRANNRVVIAVLAPPKAGPLSEEAGLASARVGGVALSPDGAAFAGALAALPARLEVEVRTATGATAKLPLELSFAPPAAASAAAAVAAPVASAPVATAAAGDDLPPLIALGAGAPEVHAAPPPTSAAPASAAPPLTFAAPPAVAGPPPPAAMLSVVLPPPGAVVYTESLWIKGSTDPANQVTANGQRLVLDAAGRFAAKVPLRRGDQLLSIVSTDPEGNTAVLERKLTVDPDGLFVLLLGEGDFGQSGAQLAGLGDRHDFSGVFLKGRAAGVLDGRWDTSQKAGGFFKEVTLSGQFDTSRRDDPTAFRELYDPARFYPVDGDSGLLVQQAASRGPLFLSIKADESRLLIGNFQTRLSTPSDQLFRYDRTLYGASVDLVKTGLKLGGREGALDSRVTAFAASPDDRARHAHAELRGTGGTVFWLRHSDLVEGSERVRIVVRDAATGLELLRTEQQRDVDYSLRAAEGRLVFKQPIPSTADTAFLANANFTTAMAGNPILVVLDYEYRGALGDGSTTAGARVQETLFGVVTAGGGLVREGYAAGAPYTLGAVNLGVRPRPRTFVALELAQSSGSDAESYASQDGGMTFGTLGANCLNPSVDVWACKQSGRALHLEAGFELADWVKREPAPGAAPAVNASSTAASAGDSGAPGNATSTLAQAAPAQPLTITGPDGLNVTLPNGLGTPGPGAGPGAIGGAASGAAPGPDWLRANAYLDLRDRGFSTSGGAADQGATKAGLLLRWTPDLKTQLTGRLDQVESDVALSFDPAAGFQTRRMLHRFTALQLQRTLGDPGTSAGRFTFLAEATDVYTDDPSLGAVSTDQLVAGGVFRATPQLTFNLLQEADWRADVRQYPRTGDRLATTLGGTWKIGELLYAQATETIRWSGENSTQIGLRTPLFGPTGSLYGTERFSLRAGQLQSTTVVGAEQRLSQGSRMYGEYQLDGQSSDTAQRAVLGLMNRWEIRPGLFLSVGYERAQVLGHGGLGLGGLTQTVPGAAPGSSLGGVNGVSNTGAGSLSPGASCIPGTTPAPGTPPQTGQAGTCSASSTLGYNPAGGYSPGATSRDAGSVGLELVGWERLKASARAELRADKADAALAGVVPGVADRLHLLFAGDATGKWTEDLGLFARVHLAESRVTDRSPQALGPISGGVAIPATVGQARTESRWVELTAGLAFRPVRWDTVAVLFKVTHLIDQRPLDFTSGLTDEQSSDVIAISPTFELPWRLAMTEKLAYKHSHALLGDGPAFDTHTWLWINRLDFHLKTQLDLSGEFRLLKLRGPSAGGSTTGGDGERGVLLEAAWRPTRYSRIGIGWNFTSFSDDELARYDHASGGFFLRAIGEY